jgi:hypothetical protein
LTFFANRVPQLPNQVDTKTDIVLIWKLPRYNSESLAVSVELPTLFPWTNLELAVFKPAALLLTCQTRQPAHELGLQCGWVLTAAHPLSPSDSYDAAVMPAEHYKISAHQTFFVQPRRTDHPATTAMNESTAGSECEFPS